MGERLESLGASIHNRSPQHHRMVFSAINGIFFHRRDLLTLTGIKTIDAVVQHPRQHDHDRKNFGYRVAFCFGVIHRAEDPIEFEEAPDFEYNKVDRILVFIEHLFDRHHMVPYVSHPFLVDLGRTLITQKT